ncbi:MAG: 1-acyl-sn-glycerol-3-phosphate acyltransferase [Candidatus Hydrogenedentes bacterium]|nr:1-acyl-sn-glycerol-3-phosphate acyltransferase [Candidatus Hydrogenedentota bacterium]
MVTRMAAVLSWTVAAFGIRVLGAPVGWLSPALGRKWRRWIFRAWGRVTWRIIGMRVEVHGTPPSPPFIQVTNHVSYLDTALMGGLMGCVFVAKAEMERWPVFGRIAKGMGTIFIRRDRMRDTVRVNDLITKVIDSEEGLQIFAESTTSRGVEVRPFKTALLEPAARRRYPVHYAAITYRTPEGYPAAADVVCWWTMVPFLWHALALFRLPYFNASVTFGEAPIVADDRKALALELRDAVQRIFVPIPQGPATLDKALKEGLPDYPFAR